MTALSPSVVHRAESRAGWWFLAPTMVFLLITGVFPLGYLLNLSVRAYDVTSGGTEEFVGLQNYAQAIGDTLFLESLRTTGLYILIAVPCEVVLGLGLALLLHRFGRYTRARGVIRVLLTVPMLVTPVVSGLFFGIILDKQYGVLDYLLGLVGLPQPAWLSTPGLALFSIAMVDVWSWTPFFMLIILAGLSAVPRSVEEAAILDGATRWGRLVTIYLPYIRPVLAAALIIHVADLIRNFGAIFTLTDGGPGIATQTFSIYVERLAFHVFNLGDAAAMSIFALIFTIILGQVFTRFVHRERDEGI